MTMTRKDFQALADGLRAVRPVAMSTAPKQALANAQWARCVVMVGTACYAANGHFDRGRFETACGLDDLGDIGPMPRKPDKPTTDLGELLPRIGR